MAFLSVSFFQLMKFINRCGRVCFKLSDSQHELPVNYYLLFFFKTLLTHLYFVLNLGFSFDDVEPWKH